MAEGSHSSSGLASTCFDRLSAAERDAPVSGWLSSLWEAQDRPLDFGRESALNPQLCGWQQAQQRHFLGVKPFLGGVGLSEQGGGTSRDELGPRDRMQKKNILLESNGHPSLLWRHGLRNELGQPDPGTLQEIDLEELPL